MSDVFDPEFLKYFPVLDGPGCNIADMLYVDEIVAKINSLKLSPYEHKYSTAAIDPVKEALTLPHDPVGAIGKGNEQNRSRNECPLQFKSKYINTDETFPQTQLIEPVEQDVIIRDNNATTFPDHQCTQPTISPCTSKPSIPISVGRSPVVPDNVSDETFLDDEIFISCHRDVVRDHSVAARPYVRYKQQPLVFDRILPGSVDIIESKSSVFLKGTSALSKCSPPHKQRLLEQNNKCAQLIQCSQVLKTCEFPLAVVPYHAEFGSSNTTVQAMGENSLGLLIETLAHLDDRKGKGRDSDRGVRALFRSDNSNKQDRLHGGILIVTQKSKLAAWASLIKGIADVTLHVQGSLSLQTRRKNGAEKLARHDIVLTTFDVLRAKEVAAPIAPRTTPSLSESRQYTESSEESSENQSVSDSVHSPHSPQSDMGANAADFISPLAKFSEKHSIAGAGCSLLHLVKWNFILMDDSSDIGHGVNIKLSTVKGVAVKSLQHVPSRSYNARDNGSNIPRMFCLFPSPEPVLVSTDTLQARVPISGKGSCCQTTSFNNFSDSVCDSINDGTANSAEARDSRELRTQLIKRLKGSVTYLAPLLQLYRISSEKIQDMIVMLPEVANS